MSTDPRAALRYWINRLDTLFDGRRWSPLSDVAAGLFMLGILCALKSLPVPAALSDVSSLLDWSVLLLLALVVYQCILSLPLSLATLPIAIVLGLASHWLGQPPLRPSLIGVQLIVVALCLDLACLKHKSLRAVVEFMQLAALAPLWRVHHSVQLR